VSIAHDSRLQELVYKLKVLANRVEKLEKSKPRYGFLLLIEREDNNLSLQQGDLRASNRKDVVFCPSAKNLRIQIFFGSGSSGLCACLESQNLEKGGTYESKFIYVSHIRKPITIRREFWERK
jgi:hypothetical protein